LAIGFDDGRIAFSHIDDERPRWVNSGSTDGINGISWSPSDRMLAVGGDDGSVWLLDAKNTSTPPRRVATFADWVNDVAFAPTTNRLATATNDGELVVWSVSSNTSATAEIVRQHRSNSDIAFTSLAWHPHGKVLAVGLANGVIQIWDMDAARFTRSLFGHRDLIASLDWSGGSQLVSSSRDGTVKTWDVEHPSSGQRLNRGEAPVRHAVWNSAGSRLAWRDVEGTTIIWNQHTRSPEDEFFESDAGATALAWHPMYDCIAFARADTVLLFEIGATTDPTEFRSEGTVWMIRFSPGGQRIATAGAGKSIEVWDVATGAKVATLDHGESVRALCWTSPSEVCSIDQLATLRRWYLKGELAEAVASMKLPTDFATSLAVNPERTQLAVATQEGLLHLVDLKSFTVSGRLTGHQGTSWSVAYSETGNRLFSGGQDGTLRIWDLKTRLQALQIQAHDSAVWSVALHGKKLATTGADGAVRLWNGNAHP
jgi:WD40 repeat protein